MSPGPPVITRLLRDREHRAAQQCRGLIRALLRIALCLLGSLSLLGRGADGRRSCPLGQLAWQQVIAKVAGRDLYDLTALTERLHVLKQDRLGHR